MNKGLERKHNLLKVISALQREGGLTQAQLKERCGLLASTVSYLVADLRKFHLIKDLGQVPSGGRVGKPGFLIGLDHQEASFLGLYAQDDRLQTQVIGIDHRLLDRRQIDFDDLGVEEAIINTIREQLRRYPQIRGVGIAIKGIVSKDGNISSHRRSDKKGREGFWGFKGLPDTLQRIFPRVLFSVENDANCAAVHYHHKSCQKHQYLVVYLLNSRPFGLGCGILIDGNIYRGASGAAGEFFEKDSRLRELADSFDEQHEKEGFVRHFIPAILPHMLQTAWMLDPHELILAGSFMDSLAQTDLQEVKIQLEGAQIPSGVKAHINRLDPARGAALLVSQRFVTDLLKEVDKR